MGIKRWWNDSSTNWERLGVVAAVVIGIIGIVVSIVIAYINPSASGGIAAAPSPLRSSANPTQVPAPVPPPAPEPEPVPPAVSQIEVTSPVANYCNSWGGIKYSEGEERIGTTDVVDAVTCWIYTWRQDGKPEKWSSFEYLLEGDASRMSGVLGISSETEDTDNKLRYEVTDAISKKVLQKGVASYGKPVKINASVRGLSRIAVRGKVTSTEDESSIGFVLGDLVLS